MLPSMSIAGGGIYPSAFLQQSTSSPSSFRRASIPQNPYPHARMPYLGPGSQDDAIPESYISTRQTHHVEHHHERPPPLDFSQHYMIYGQDQHQRRTSIETPTVSRFQSLALQSPFHSSPMDSPSNLHSFINASTSSPISHAPVGVSANPMTSSTHDAAYGNDEQHHRIFGNWSPATPSPSTSAPPPPLEKYHNYYSSGKKFRTNSTDEALIRTSNPPTFAPTPQYPSTLQQQRAQAIKAISISVDSSANDDRPPERIRSSRKRSSDGEVYTRQQSNDQQQQQQQPFSPPTHIVSPEAILKAQAEEEPESSHISFSSYFDNRLATNTNDIDSNEPPFIRRRKSIALGLPGREQSISNTAPSFSIPTFTESAQTRSPSPEILSDKDSPSPEESVSAPLTNRKFSASGKANHSLVSVVSNSGAAEADALSKLDDMNFNQPQPIPMGKKERLKRPPNAYLLFNRDTRHKLLESMPHLTVAEISKQIGERWKALSPVS
jgi:HMG (high mobility group) box